MLSRYENQKYKQGYKFVIGCDEVGRGCLAGPVAAAAVILPVPADGKLKVPSYKVIKSCGIRDSKLLGADKRQELSEIIKLHALWGIGVVDEKVIDKINIHNASLLAMRRAVESLMTNRPINTDTANGLTRITNYGADDNKFFLYVDGKFPVPDVGMEQEAVVDGDNKILSVAAASIIAKVFRDELMKQYHRQYPIYNFAQHKGYATLFHRRMVIRHGLSDIHRVSFCSQLVG